MARAGRRHGADVRAVVADRSGDAARRVRRRRPGVARLLLGPARRGGRARARRGHEGHAHDHRPRTAVDELVAEPPPAGVPPAAERLRGVRQGGRAALRRATSTATCCGTSRTSPTWLYPQSRCSRGRCTPVSPHLYRGLVRAAYPAVRDADPGAKIVIGVLSPRGQRLRAGDTVMRPLVFLRAFGCRSDRWTRLRTSECRKLPPGHRRRLRDPPVRRPHRPRARAPERRRRLARAGRQPDGDARPPAAGARAARHDAPLRHLHRRVRLPDEPARQVRRGRAAHAGLVAPARRLPGLAQPADPAVRAVPVARRAAQLRRLLQRLAVRPAVRRRAREAGAGALRHAVRARRGAQPPVGSGAARRPALGHRRAAQDGAARGVGWRS